MSRHGCWDDYRVEREKRMKKEETSEKQSLNIGGIDVLMNRRGGDERDQKREKNGVIANNTEKIKLSALQQNIWGKISSVAVVVVVVVVRVAFLKHLFTHQDAVVSVWPGPDITDPVWVPAHSWLKSWWWHPHPQTHHTFNWKILAEVLAATRLGPDMKGPRTIVIIMIITIEKTSRCCILNMDQTIVISLLFFFILYIEWNNKSSNISLTFDHPFIPHHKVSVTSLCSVTVRCKGKKNAYRCCTVAMKGKLTGRKKVKGIWFLRRDKWGLNWWSLGVGAFDWAI